jgi:hypothetical protein
MLGYQIRIGKLGKSSKNQSLNSLNLKRLKENTLVKLWKLKNPS